jgi:hypothetical protein
MSITITGMEELIAKLGKVAAIDTLERPMDQSLLLGEAYMKDYPPAPPRSRYVRTGTLGRRWTTNVERKSDGLVGKVGNNTPYGPWVQSAQFQTRFHARTGWRTDEQFIRENETAIRDFFQQAVNAALEG